MTSATLEQLNPTDPFLIPEHIGALELVMMNAGDPVSSFVEAMMSSSPTTFGLRIAGGCSNMSHADRENMLDWFATNLRHYKGFVSSGATRDVDDSGRIDPMVTEVPAVLARLGNVVTISTVPRVGRMQLVERNRLRMFREDKWGQSISNPNPGVHMIVLVQQRLGNESEWDGDVETYVDLFNNRRRFGGWQFACIVWNGGGVTKTEIKLTARSGWPVILVEGSGRAADEYAAALRDGTLDLTLPDDEEPVPYDPAQHQLYVVSKDEPFSLRDQLRALGYPA